MENTVENIELGTVLDDAALSVEEQPMDSPISEVLDEPENQQTEPDAAPAPAKEPGYIKTRVNKAVEKAVRETEARLNAKYESMLAPIRESIVERQAQELVDSGEVKTLELAKELIALRQGVPTSASFRKPEADAPTRDNGGKFAPKSEETAAKASFLVEQAVKIKQNKGIDVMAAYNRDPEIKQRVLSGEWDFYDVAEQMGGEGHKKSVPAPMHSPNSGQVSPTTISSMSAAQFKRLQENLASGKSYDLRKIE